MNRSVVVLACGVLVSGCSYTAGLLKPGPMMSTLRLESEPPGADAKTSLGNGCRTPCSLQVMGTGDFSVTFSLPGYAPQTVPVQFIPPQDPRVDPNARLDPNPVYGVLEAAAAPPAKPRPPVRKKPKKPPPANAAAATPPPAATPAAASPFGPPPSGPPPR